MSSDFLQSICSDVFRFKRYILLDTRKIIKFSNKWSLLSKHFQLAKARLEILQRFKGKRDSLHSREIQGSLNN